MPLEWLLERVDAPSEVALLGGNACIAEQLVGGYQCTLEGFAFQGGVHSYGVVDSIRAPNRSTFTRYQYPSRLPESVQHEMASVAARVIGAMGFDHGAFNIEFFYDRDADHLWILEINTRASQSHSELFAMVDGAPNLKVTVDLALGRRPDMPRREGSHACAAKFFLRSWHDATVVAVPTREQIAAIEAMVPGTSIQVHVAPGDRLSSLPDQDSYSYELGEVHVGGTNEVELRHKFENCERALGISLAVHGHD